MLNRILVALDGSSCANLAFDYALRLAKAEASAVYVCWVVDSRDGEADAENGLVAAVQKATLAGVPAGKHVRTGEPGAAIVACAAEIRADVIVMGVGSVAEYVQSSARCSVVTVRA
jgi:nucleotide-binding universal stress UspA family protein